MRLGHQVPSFPVCLVAPYRAILAVPTSRSRRNRRYPVTHSGPAAPSIRRAAGCCANDVAALVCSRRCRPLSVRPLIPTHPKPPPPPSLPSDARTTFRGVVPASDGIMHPTRVIENGRRHDFRANGQGRADALNVARRIRPPQLVEARIPGPQEATHPGLGGSPSQRSIASKTRSTRHTGVDTPWLRVTKSATPRGDRMVSRSLPGLSSRSAQRAQGRKAFRESRPPGLRRCRSTGCAHAPSSPRRGSPPIGLRCDKGLAHCAA